MSILVIDNYDSFTYNLVHAFEKISSGPVTVFLNDKFALEEVEAFDRIVLSPGPGIPAEAGLLNDVIRIYAGKKPMLGVCLGHQAIAEVFGASLVNLEDVFHGVSSSMYTLMPDPLWNNISVPFEAGRYHSWVVKKPLPPGFEILAEDENGQVMAYVHRAMKMYGVQFHPESVLTPQGEQMLANWLNLRW